jgi:hypothetical protein
MKTWKYLVAGGTIGLIVYIMMWNINSLTKLLASFQEFFGRLFFGVKPSFDEVLGFSFLFSFILAPLVLIILGVIIGWIVGKVKSRKKLA